MSILHAAASATPPSYNVAAARIFDGDEPLTYGDFRAWLPIAFKNALDHGETELVFNHRSIAKLFRRCRETVVAWCSRARNEGLLKWRYRRLQKADGTWRRIASGYTVALTVTLRRIWRAALAKLASGTASQPTAEIRRAAVQPKPQTSVVSPAVEFSPQQHSATSSELPAPQKAEAEKLQTRISPRAWTCRRCQTANGLAAPTCYRCSAEKPFAPQEPSHEAT